ncbi:MAG: MFS transporter [Negativicutes bacterium]|nr:MFS transporter [Negativicutes bacterium]
MNWKTRYNVLTIIFIAYLVCYMDRMVMATAIPFIAKDFSLSPLEMGAVLSAFFFSYALSQIPGGLLADKFGARAVVTGGLIWWSIFTAVTGLANSLKSMIVYRVLFGIGEGIFPPGAFKTVASWFPNREVGRANAIMLTTNCLGPALAPIFVAYFIVAWGWRMVFFSLLIPGIIIAALVWRYCKHPRASLHLSAAELAEIEGDVKEPTCAPQKKIGFGQLVRIPILWKCFFTLFFFNIALWGLMSWLPTYLLQVRGLSIMNMGIAASLPFLSGTVGILLSGYLSDRWFKNHRHLLVVFGASIGAVFIYLNAMAVSAEAAVSYQIIGFFFLWIAMASIFTIPIATLPAAVAGSAMGLVNTAGQAAGFLSPLLVGYILTITKNDYYYAFMMFVICLLISSLAALTIGSTKTIPVSQNIDM